LFHPGRGSGRVFARIARGIAMRKRDLPGASESARRL
jgi:hypothetical protein